MRMDKGCRLWLLRTAYRNYWRVYRWYDIDDLVQDGYLCYYKVVRHPKYKDVKDPRVRMALFKRTYSNYITDLAKKRTALAEVDHPLCIYLDNFRLPEPISPLDILLGPDYSLDVLNIVGAPPEVNKVLDLFASEDGRRRLRSLYRYKEHGQRETYNERLARLTGLSPDTRFDKVFYDFFTAETPAYAISAGASHRRVKDGSNFYNAEN